MKRLDYLKKALNHDLASNLSWITSAFCIVKESPQSYLSNPYPFRLISTHARYQFINAEKQIEEIEDSQTKEPLLRFKDQLEVDKTWAPNITSSITCTVGNLIFNSVSILPSFGSKYPFTNGKISLSIHEDYIAKRLTDTPRDNSQRDQSKIYVDEYLIFQDTLIYLEQLAPMTNWSATRKLISRPDGIKEFRQKLLKEYEGRINDPTVFAEYEEKLRNYDKEWLKDDPSYGTFIKGKILDIARKKMFLAIGIPERLDLKSKMVPITSTLEDGQPTDPIQRTAILNGSRFGSYSRGTETINGGVVSKTVIRIGNNYKIDIEDCGTTFGLHTSYTKESINDLVGRIVIEDKKMIPILTTEQAEYYLGRTIVVRSPAFCKAGPGDRLCKSCSGPALSQYQDGLAIPLTEISQLILTQSLKAMHGKFLSTARADLERVLS
ncbi:MAG TPA: hypothetical protein VN843_01530 [Anaerolineales bacterium]|nr:hypothetical protein [Anaerolineales bacterium]